MSIYPSGEKVQGQSNPNPDNQQLLATDANLISDLIEALQTGKITSIQAGTNITIDNTDPLNPIISASGALGVNSVTGVSVDNTDPANPVVNATINETDAFLLDRANHTGTQTASTISDFDTEVSNNTDVTANTAKVSFPEAPNDGNTYARESNAWTAILKILNNVVNTVTGTFGFGNGDYRFQLYSNQTQWGRVTGVITGYWESIFTGGRQKMLYQNSDEYTPEMGGDYSVNIDPANTPNNLPTVKYVNPVSSTISTATGTIDSTYTSNQTIEYTGSGGNLTIESTYLNINEVGAVMQIGANQFTLVAGTGVTLIEPDSLFTSEKQYVSLGIYKQNSTTYIINGRTA